MNRVNHLVSQLSEQQSEKKARVSTSNVSSFSANAKRDDDIVVVSAIRTAIGKAKRGSFKDTSAIHMLAPCFEYLIKDSGIDPSIVDDVVVGTVLAPGGLRASECRQALFLAGFPLTTTVRTVNRQCSSGLQAIADIAAAIKAGYIECGIGSGVESMSKDRFGADPNKVTLTDDIKQNTDALNCLLPMGITSENVASRFGLSREQQDYVSELSHKRAARAISNGLFKEEIVPVTTTWKDPKSGKTKTITVGTDDGVRASTTKESLSKLRPVFKKGGSTTAGNSSQVSDGAAAVLLMRRDKAKSLGLKIMGVFRHFAVSGVPPDVMGIGPAFAIPKVLQMAKLGVKDIDLYEVNEAFASQYAYCAEKLGIDLNKCNVNGGAIALGHPLGATGARMTVTLLNEMRRRGDKRGIVSMCIGSGMGAAAIYELD